MQISLKLVPSGPIYNEPALAHIMASRRTDDKPLRKPMTAEVDDAYMRHSASMYYELKYMNMYFCYPVINSGNFSSW